jgi:hypothetical protein
VFSVSRRVKQRRANMVASIRKYCARERTAVREGEERGNGEGGQRRRARVHRFMSEMFTAF